MVTQPIPSERRQHRRKGAMALLESITYGLLRTYGSAGEDTRDIVMGGSLQSLQQRCRPTSTENRSSQPGFRWFDRLLAFAHREKTRVRSWLRRKGMTMTANLVIVVSNPKPKRERHYPETWLLYSEGLSPVEVHVVHDSAERPYVLDEGAA